MYSVEGYREVGVLVHGKNLSFAEVQAMMKPGLAEHEMIDGKPVWGWWRLTDLGYATFMRTPR